MSWVVLDDTTPELQYDGTWAPITATPDVNQQGNWGPVFQNTLHSASGISKLTYTFDGTRAQIIGTTNGLSGSVGTMTCVVDGRQQSVDVGRNKQTNSHCFCDARDLSPATPHTIEFSVDVPDGSPFLFDKLQYRPLHNSSISKAVLAYDSDQPGIRYDGVWKSSADRTAKLTQVTGSKMTMMFNGTSLQWYGAYYPTFSRTESTGTWAVDGSLPQTFRLGRDITDGLVFHHQLLFETGPLKETEHRLEVVYRGDTNTVPLSLDSLVVLDGRLERDRISSPHNKGDSSDDGKSGKISTTAKVGIGLAVTLAFILLLLIPFFFGPWNRKRKRDKYRRERAMLHSSPPPKQPPPRKVGQPTYEQLPFINPIPTTMHAPSMNIHQSLPNPFGVQEDDDAPQVYYNPHSTPFIPPSQYDSYSQAGDMPIQLTEPQRERKISTSTIASIVNPFCATSISPSCSVESADDLTNSISTNPSSNAWSHNHMPPRNNSTAGSTALDIAGSAINGRLGEELRDVKRSTPTFVYLQNDDTLGSTTTIRAAGTAAPMYSTDGTALDPFNPPLGAGSNRYENDDPPMHTSYPRT